MRIAGTPCFKTKKCGEPLRLVTLVFYSLAHPHSVSSNMSKLPSNCFYLLQTPVASASCKLISAVIFCTWLSPNFSAAICPMTLILRWILEKLLIFSSISFFLIVRKVVKQLFTVSQLRLDAPLCFHSRDKHFILFSHACLIICLENITRSGI